MALYLNRKSYSHPAQKCRVMMSLLESMHRISDSDREHLEDKRRYLQNVFLKNGFSWTEIKRTFACFDNKKQKAQREEEEEPILGEAVVPF